MLYFRFKNQPNERFDGELAEQMWKMNKLFQKFKKVNFTLTNWYIKKLITQCNV